MISLLVLQNWQKEKYHGEFYTQHGIRDAADTDNR